MTTRIRVVLVEDHGLVRAGVRALLDGQPDIEIVGECGDGDGALALAAEARPDVMLLDLSLPGLHGLEVIARLEADQPDVHVLVLSMYADVEYVARAIRFGARGYLPKDVHSDDLLEAIRTVARGGTYLSPQIPEAQLRMRMDGDADHPLDRLTTRQREVLKLVAEGQSTREIAAVLDISPKTVEVHRSHIMERLDIHDVAGLARFAVAHGLVPPEA